MSAAAPVARPSAELEARARLLQARYGELQGPALLRALLGREALGRVALVSSFGTESAVLLHMMSQVCRHMEIIFVDTGRLFPETLAYRDRLVAHLGLTDVRTITPRPEILKDLDPRGHLYASQGSLCCYIRRVEPLERALEGVTTWISGRKRFQGVTRAALPTFEISEGRLKVNPLADWSKDALDAYFEAHGLPRHPLESLGYASVGCAPCTTATLPGESPRAGRWRGQDKVECGIHIPGAGPDGRVSPLERRAPPRQEEASP